MNAVMFVDGQLEEHKISIILKSASLDFDFEVISSFDLLMRKFDSTKVDVFICQLGLKNCKALELLQLARMYNPDVINMATGDNNCVEELVDTFNAENLFRFISMPWLYKDDIITPIHDAAETMHEKIQREYDIKALEEDAQVIKNKVTKLREKDDFFKELFTDSKEVFKNLFSQNYYFTSNESREEDLKFALFLYDTYIEYFYNNIDDLNPTIRDIVSLYRKPAEGRFFTVKHNISEPVKDEVKSRIVFILYALNAFIADYCKEYKIDAVIGKTGNHYLMKYEYIFPGEFDTGFMNSISSFNYKMLMLYINGCCLKSDISVTEKGIECKIIVM